MFLNNLGGWDGWAWLGWLGLAGLSLGPPRLLKNIGLLAPCVPLEKLIRFGMGERRLMDCR